MGPTASAGAVESLKRLNAGMRQANPSRNSPGSDSTFCDANGPSRQGLLFLRQRCDFDILSSRPERSIHGAPNPRRSLTFAASRMH